jgi:hypothetical protein
MAPLITDAKVLAVEELLDGKLDQIIRDFAKDGGIPGVSLTVHRHASAEGAGETVFRSYGIAHGDQPVIPMVSSGWGCIFPDCQLTRRRVFPSAR